jgi:hypothetical protein
VRVRDRKGMWEERGERGEGRRRWEGGKVKPVDVEGLGGGGGRKGLELTIKAFLYNKKFWFCNKALFFI